MGVLALWGDLRVCGLALRDRSWLFVVVHGEQPGCGGDGEKRDGENVGQVGTRRVCVVEGVVADKRDDQVDRGNEGR